MGEYKEGLGTAANCTKCVFGVTTPAEGSVHRNSCSSEWPSHLPDFDSWKVRYAAVLPLTDALGMLLLR
jgi:hypothetical protein